MMRPKRLHGMLALLAALAAAPACGRDAEAGHAAPPIKATTLDGHPFSLAAERGKVVIVNFWATWCPPCREEMPALQAYYDKHRSEGLEMLAISVDVPDDLDKVRQVMKAYHFPATLMSGAELPGYGHIRMIPQTYVIDRSGVLQRDGGKDRGKIDLPTLEQIVTPLLRTKTAQN